MADQEKLQEKIAVLEARVQELKDQIQDPPKPGFWASLLTWDMARNLVLVIGIPAAFFAAWNTIDTEILRAHEIKKHEQLKAAVDDVGELQEFNSRVYQLQAAQDDGAIFAIQEAKRGRIERLTKDLFEFWKAYPNEFTRSEKTTLVEALIGQEQTDRALDVLSSIDQSGMNSIWQGDMDILRARVLFATGPAQDIDAAREAFRDAIRHTEGIERPGRKDALFEKYVGVRLLNELWLGSDCKDLTAFAEYLDEKLTSEPIPAGLDAVRDNSVTIMGAHARQCPGL
jgi:hypothetical protein